MASVLSILLRTSQAKQTDASALLFIESDRRRSFFVELMEVLAWLIVKSTCLVNSKKAALTSEKIRSGGNTGGRSRKQKLVRLRVLTPFERFL